jgi:hypothetical protein
MKCYEYGTWVLYYETFNRLYPGSSVAEKTTHNSKIMGLNPATRAERDKKRKKLYLKLR